MCTINQARKNERKRKSTGGTAASGGTFAVAFKGCVPEIPGCYRIELDSTKFCHGGKFNERNE